MTAMLERTAPGWYEDPSGRFDLRFFDGTSWTEQTKSRTPSSSVRSGWYEDPAGTGLLRFFDGSRWTERVAPAPVRPAVPVATPPTTQSAPAPAPAPRRSLQRSRLLVEGRPAAAVPPVVEEGLRAPARRALRPVSTASPVQSSKMPFVPSPAAPPVSESVPTPRRVSGRAMRRAGTAIMLLGVVACLYTLWVTVGSNLWADLSQRELREDLAASAPAPEITIDPSQIDISEPLSPLPVEPVEPTEPAPAAEPPPVPTLAADGKTVGTIRIPSIGVDEVFVAGTEVPDLKKGPGVWRDGAFPGTPGNATISGHRTTYGAPFRRIDELKTGDQIIVSVAGQPDAVFEVRGQEIVPPSRVEVTYPTEGVRLTLTTCDPVGSDAARLVVQAELVEGAWKGKALPAEGWTFQK